MLRHQILPMQAEYRRSLNPKPGRSIRTISPIYVPAA